MRPIPLFKVLILSKSESSVSLSTFSNRSQLYTSGAASATATAAAKLFLYSRGSPLFSNLLNPAYSYESVACMIELLSMESSLSIGQGNAGELEGGKRNSEDLEEDDIVEADDNTNQVEGTEVLEPYVGMEFDSEDDARKFYNDYARREGFMVRIMQRRRSEIDGRTLARRLGCNKQGFSPNTRGKIGPERKPRPSAREGCKATILFKLEKSGKWVVTRFEKDHNHPLVVTDRDFSNVHDKEKKIEELTREVHRQEELCRVYREKLINLLENVEKQTEQLSSKVLSVVQNVRKAEDESLTFHNS